MRNAYANYAKNHRACKYFALELANEWMIKAAFVLRGDGSRLYA